jgi:hypothetical protein
MDDFMKFAELERDLVSEFPNEGEALVSAIEKVQRGGQRLMLIKK